MEIVNDLALMKKKRLPVFLAAGFFDGLHLGHRRVIDHAARAAAKAGGKIWILTFDKHPASIIKGKPVPRLLTSTAHKLSLLKKMNVNGCIVLPFNKKLADTPPEEFVRNLVDSIPSLKGIYVGMNWRFGRRGQGNTDLLKKMGRKAGFSTNTVNQVFQNGKPISSTIIREIISKGKLDAAKKMYGRAFSILGTVIKGHTIGRTLGFPTANIMPQNEVFPPLGVYAVSAVIGRRHLTGVLNYGTRPTFGTGKRKSASIELHILDFEGELYGKEVEVFFHGKIRNERRFSSEAALQKQIEKDVSNARSILTKKLQE